MRRFRFNLESVLTVRQKALQDARIALASIVNVYNKQNEVLNEMIFALNAISDESEKYRETDGFNPQMVANYSAYSYKLLQDIKMQKNIIEKTKLDLLRQKELTKQAYIKVKSLENLKQKQKEQYNKEIQMEEFKLIDDIVNSRRTIA